MITVGMNYQVIDGKQRDFEGRFRAMLGGLQAADGHLQSSMYRNIDDDCAYLIISEWSDQEKFTQYIESPAFREVTDRGKEQILAGRPQHKIYQT